MQTIPTLPSSLVNDVIYWYHHMLSHCGAGTLYDTINSRFYYPNLRQRCEAFHCNQCQLNKHLGPGYGQLPPRHAPLMPWAEVAVDLIGPWKIKIQQQELEFLALTCIDPVTNLLEIIRIDNKTANHVAQKFAQVWLSRYPRPLKCIHDN